MDRFALLTVWGVAVSTLSSVCGGPTDDLPRQAVSGTVKFKGQPLTSGIIQFQPTSPGEVTAGGAGVTDGHYTIRKAEGLVPGKYQVMITSAGATATTPGAMPGDAPPPPKEAIPAKYNAKTTLNASVTKEGPNTFDFNLDAK